MTIAKGVALTGGAAIIVGISQTAIEQYGKNKRIDVIEKSKREMHEKTLQTEIEKTKIIWDAKKQPPKSK
jgi:cell division ATPase FtsA